MTITYELLANITTHANRLFEADISVIDQTTFEGLQETLPKHISLPTIYLNAKNDTTANHLSFKTNFINHLLPAVLAHQSVSLMDISGKDKVTIFQLLYNNASALDTSATKTAPLSYKEAWRLMTEIQNNKLHTPRLFVNQKFTVVHLIPLFIEFYPDHLDSRGYDLLHPGNPASRQLAEFYAQKMAIDEDDFTPELKHIYDCLENPQMPINEEDPQAFRIESLKFMQSKRKHDAQQLILTLLHSNEASLSFEAFQAVIAKIKNLFSPTKKPFDFFKEASLSKFKKPYSALIEIIHEIQFSPKYHAKQSAETTLGSATKNATANLVSLSLFDATACTPSELLGPDKALYELVARNPNKTMASFHQQLVMACFIDRRAIRDALKISHSHDISETAGEFLNQFKIMRKIKFQDYRNDFRLKYQALVDKLPPAQKSPGEYVIAQILSTLKSDFDAFTDHYDQIRNSVQHQQTREISTMSMNNSI